MRGSWYKALRLFRTECSYDSAAIIPLRFKLPYTAFVCVLVPAYWVVYGPANFLWGSSIALFATLMALWTGNRLLPSMMALGVLLPETAWIVDFAIRLVLGQDAIPIGGTGYMFAGDVPLWVRGISLIRVECYAGHRGEETPRRIHIGEQTVELVEVLDRWLSPEHRYFKCRGADDAIYILRHDVRSDCWELALYDRCHQ